MKLPCSIIIRLSDLLLFSRLEALEGDAEKAFRLAVKRRYFIRCMKTYVELFQHKKDRITPKVGGIKEPYIYNDLLEDDQFALEIGPKEEVANLGDGSSARIDALTDEGIKMQLKQIYNET